LKIMNIQKPAASLAVLCVASIAASVALAEEIPSVKLEVSRPVDPAHATQVYQRIHGAAQEVCAQLESRELMAHDQYQRCVDKAVADAVGQMRSAEVTKIHLSEHPLSIRE
jgi:UrcA family protein